MSDEKRERKDAEPDDLVRLLDEAAAVEAAERSEAENVTNAPGSRNVERILEREWSREPPARSRWTKPRILGLCVAAAIVLAFALIWNRSPEGDGPSGQYLGDDRVRITSPNGQVREWPKKIVWTPDASAREYDVDVLDDESGRVVTALGRTIATEIEVPSEESARWPSKIEIRLKVLKKDGSQSSTTTRVELVK